MKAKCYWAVEGRRCLKWLTCYGAEEFLNINKCLVCKCLEWLLMCVCPHMCMSMCMSMHLCCGRYIQEKYLPQWLTESWFEISMPVCREVSWKTESACGTQKCHSAVQVSTFTHFVFFHVMLWNIKQCRQHKTLVIIVERFLSCYSEDQLIFSPHSLTLSKILFENK